MAFPPWKPTRDGLRPRQAEMGALPCRQGLLAGRRPREREPGQAPQLQDLWWAEAARHNVLPLDWRGIERLNAEADGPAEPDRRRQDVHLLSGPGRAARDAAPRILNKSWTITADIEVPEGGAEGMIVTHGGMVGGYGLYLRDGKPTFVYNYLALDRFTVAGKEPLPTGKVKLVVDFAYDGAGERRQRRHVTLSVNGTKVAEGKLPKTIPIQSRSARAWTSAWTSARPVDFTYKLPFAFTGNIEKVTVALK